MDVDHHYGSSSVSVTLDIWAKGEDGRGIWETISSSEASLPETT